MQEEDSGLELPVISVYMGFEAFQSEAARHAVSNVLIVHGGPIYRTPHTVKFTLMAKLDPHEVFIQTDRIYGLGPKRIKAVNTAANNWVQSVMNSGDATARHAAAKAIASAKAPKEE